MHLCSRLQSERFVGVNHESRERHSENGPDSFKDNHSQQNSRQQPPNVAQYF